MKQKKGSLGRRIAIGLILVALIVIGVLLYASYDFYFGPVPKTAGAERVIGLNGDVTIHRDSWGIPHIYANTVEDLFFSQGYTHAQDRWWQMELTRHIGRGELSQVTGDNEAIRQLDLAIHTLGWLDSAEIAWQNVTPATRRAVMAYTDGVNAYIGERGTDDLAMEYSLLALSGELGNLFALLGQDISVEPWQPVDSLLWEKIMGWQSSGNLWQELALLQKEHRSEPLLSGFSQNLFELIGLTSNIRGTALVVAGEHTETGLPLMMNDLQDAPVIPSRWFEMGLHCRQPSADCPYDVVGMSVAGVPGIVVGHNDRVAWGINTLNADTQDLYVLKLNPQNNLQYEWDGEWINLVERIVVIKINQEISYAYPIYYTHFGPVLSNLEDHVTDRAIALRWAELEHESSILTAVLKINQAQSWQDFRAAARLWTGSPVELFFADVDGNIGYQMGGGFPVRHKEHNPAQPVDGWTSRYRWRGMVPFEILPARFNPSGGFLYSADEPIRAEIALRDMLNFLDSPVTVFFSRTDASPYRFARLTQLLDDWDLHNVDTLEAIQSDTFNSLAAEILPYISEIETDQVDVAEAIEWLNEWDLFNAVDSPQATWFEYFWATLQNMIVGDQILSTGPYETIDQIVAMFAMPQDTRWDAPETPFTQETRDTIVEQALVRSYNELLVMIGDDRDTWAWGDIHQVRFISQVVGQEDILPLTGVSINRGAYELDGCMVCLNITDYDLGVDDEMERRVKRVPSYRLIIDLADFNNSRAMHTVGQSGHLASDNYDDMIAPWRTVDYHYIRWGQAILNESSRQLDLRPAPTLTPEANGIDQP